VSDHLVLRLFPRYDLGLSEKEAVNFLRTPENLETKGRKLSNPAYFRLTFCPYTRHN
jgi:hypothetical protein